MEIQQKSSVYYNTPVHGLVQNSFYSLGDRPAVENRNEGRIVDGMSQFWVTNLSFRLPLAVRESLINKLSCMVMAVLKHEPLFDGKRLHLFMSIFIPVYIKSVKAILRINLNRAKVDVRDYPEVQTAAFLDRTDTDQRVVTDKFQMDKLKSALRERDEQHAQQLEHEQQVDNDEHMEDDDDEEDEEPKRKKKRTSVRAVHNTADFNAFSRKFQQGFHRKLHGINHRFIRRLPTLEIHAKNWAAFVERAGKAFMENREEEDVMAVERPLRMLPCNNLEELKAFLVEIEGCERAKAEFKAILAARAGGSTMKEFIVVFLKVVLTGNHLADSYINVQDNPYKRHGRADLPHSFMDIFKSYSDSHFLHNPMYRANQKVFLLNLFHEFEICKNQKRRIDVQTHRYNLKQGEEAMDLTIDEDEPSYSRTRDRKSVV